MRATACGCGTCIDRARLGGEEVLSHGRLAKRSDYRAGWHPWLSVSGFAAMHHLFERQDIDSAASIAQRLALTPSGITRLLNLLERRGIVAREEVGHDPRACLARKAGQSVASRLRAPTRPQSGALHAPWRAAHLNVSLTNNAHECQGHSELWRRGIVFPGCTRQKVDWESDDVDQLWHHPSVWPPRLARRR
jgi:hypothetical protein